MGSVRGPHEDVLRDCSLLPPSPAQCSWQGGCLPLGEGAGVALALAATFLSLWPAPLTLIKLLAQLSPSSSEPWSSPGISRTFQRLVMEGATVQASLVEGVGRGGCVRAGVGV